MFFAGERMANSLSINSGKHVYRVAQFSVPESAREEFLERVKVRNALLSAQPGFVRKFFWSKPQVPANSISLHFPNGKTDKHAYRQARCMPFMK